MEKNEKSTVKLLFLNIFLTLFTAGTSSVHRLQMDLIEIETTLQDIKTSIPLVPEMLIFVLSSFVIAKFVLSYISLASYVIALYSILNNDLSDLLIPTIIAQALQNIIFNLVELCFGLFACSYYLTSAKMACNIFYFKMLSKMILGMFIWDVYWNFYNQLRYPLVKIISTRDFFKQIPALGSREYLDEENPLFRSSDQQRYSMSSY